MDKDKEIESLYKQIWWTELQFKARETYLLRRIEQLEEEISHLKNDFGDK